MIDQLNGGATPAPPHIAAFEAAARIYCQRTGQDADVQVRVPHPLILNTTMSTPFWHTIAERMFDLQMLLSSMKAAAMEAAAGVVVPR